jgi:iron-sulfur cluster repair protein YtfE (RIC family)
VTTLTTRQGEKVREDHDWLQERLRSLDNCLESILYFGEVCGDMRGFGGLRMRCRELEQFLLAHIPEEEVVFDQLRAEKKEVRDLLDTLVSEHRSLLKELQSCLVTLEAVENGETIPEDLFKLEDRLSKVIQGFQAHIRTENQLVMPLVSAGEPT